MWAIGELIVLVIYVILSIPPILIVIRLKRKKTFPVKKLTYLVIAIIPLFLFSYSQYTNHRNAELQYVGVYYLTDYPNCISCVLNLNANNSYKVVFDQEIIEQGKWKYSSGGDYWIVDIGEHGQLGSGKYRYNDRENNFK